MKEEKIVENWLFLFDCRFDCIFGFTPYIWNRNDIMALDYHWFIDGSIQTGDCTWCAVFGLSGSKTTVAAENGRRQYWDEPVSYVVFYVCRIPCEWCTWYDTRYSVWYGTAEILWTGYVWPFDTRSQNRDAGYQ